MDVAVVLFTRDLRVHDHPALTAAVAGARRVVPLFVLDDGILGTHYAAPNRVRFLLESLHDLDRSLKERGARLVVRRGDVATEVARVAADVRARTVFLSGDVSSYAQRREERLRDAGLDVCVCDGVTAVAPGALSPSLATHYRLFSPYWRRWREEPVGEPLRPPVEIRFPRVAAGRIPRPEELVSGPTSSAAPLGGEAQARRRLGAWIRDGLADYGSDRGGIGLGDDRTSRLSPYLHFGCLSPREAAARARDVRGSEPWLRELCWRDFYAQLLWARPELATADLHPRERRWRNDPEAIAAWKAGRTGLPLVDAGMRQLALEGWMHNRARLVTASFLVHDLEVDWRIGARHFYDLLVDGDVANNSGNWQWVAGTGVDTRPSRRFSPTLQARKRDPDGAYIRRYVEELAELAPPLVHEPWRLDADELARRGYPSPLVDPRTDRQLALI